MLFNGRALIVTFSGTQVRIAEIEHLQSLFKMSMVSANDQELDCDVELSVINQNHVRIYHIFYCFASTEIKNH